MSVEALKIAVRSICADIPSKLDRTRRMYLEERAAALHHDRNAEFTIRKLVADSFDVPYSSVAFTGSAQLGFSPHKETLFSPGVSDLDVAIIDAKLFSHAWQDVTYTSSGFNNLSSFGRRTPEQIAYFKEKIAKRAMILVDEMPISPLSGRWRDHQDRIGRKYAGMFNSLSIAIYMSEYAFCTKQSSALKEIGAL